jgi:hypothetical protein
MFTRPGAVPKAVATNTWSGVCSWVEEWITTFGPSTWATQFIGSIGAWAR